MRGWLYHGIFFQMNATTVPLFALAIIVMGMASASPVVFTSLNDFNTVNLERSQRRFGDGDCVYGFYGYRCGSGVDFGFVGNVIDAFSNGRNFKLFIALLSPTTTLAPAYEVHPAFVPRKSTDHTSGGLTLQTLYRDSLKGGP